MSNNPSSSEARYLSVAQLATYSGLSQPTLRRMIVEGRLVASKVGGRVLVDRHAFDDMVQATRLPKRVG